MKDEKLRIIPKQLKGEDGHRIFSIRVAETVFCEIEAISARTGRSRNELISMLLCYALDRCVVEDLH